MTTTLEPTTRIEPALGLLTRVCLVAAPGLVLAAHLVQASPPAHDTASELASIAAAQVRYQVAGVLGFAAMVLFVPAFLGLAGLVRRRHPRVAVVGLAMSLTGLLALTSLMGSSPVSLALARASDRSAMVAVTDAYESLPLTTVWALLMLLGWSLGPIVLGVGLWRSGGSPLVPILLVAGLVVQFLDAGRWPLALGFALTTAGFAVVALTRFDSLPTDPGAGARIGRTDRG